MPSAFDILKKLSSQLLLNEPIDSDKTIADFKDALEHYINYFKEDNVQTMTEAAFYNKILLTDYNSFSSLLHGHYNHILLNKLYLLTLETAHKGRVKYVPTMNELLLPLPLALYVQGNTKGVSIQSHMSPPVSLNNYILNFKDAPDAADQFLEISKELKKAYKPLPGVNIDDIIKTLSSFIKDNHTVKDREGISPFGFAMETLMLLIYPEYVHQNNNQICGVAALMVVLLRYAPHTYLNIARDLYLHGQSNTYFDISLPGRINRRDYFYEYVMIGIKRSSNYLGYYPDSPAREPLGGVTRPRSLVRYLTSLGFTDIHENIQIKNTNNTPIGVFHRFMLGGMYSSQHENEQINNQFLRKLESAVKEGKAVILSVGPSDWTFNLGQIPLGRLLSWVNIRSDHYVTLLELKKLENGNIDIHISDTSVGECIKRTLTEEAALQVISGAIICDPPKPEPKLQIEVAPTI